MAVVPANVRDQVSLAYLFARAANDAGLDMHKVVFVENRRVDEIFEAIVELVGRSALVMGMGNIGGPGLDVVRFFRNRSVVTTDTAAV